MSLLNMPCGRPALKRLCERSREAWLAIHRPLAEGTTLAWEAVRLATQSSDEGTLLGWHSDGDGALYPTLEAVPPSIDQADRWCWLEGSAWEIVGDDNSWQWCTSDGEWSAQRPVGQATMKRRKWQRRRQAAAGAAAASEARDANAAIVQALGPTFEQLRQALQMATAPLVAFMVQQIHTPWAEILGECAPDATPTARASAALHEFLGRARVGALATLSDSAADIVVGSTWLVLVRQLEHRLYSQQPVSAWETVADGAAHTTTVRNAASRASEVVAAAAGEACEVVSAATASFVGLCEMALEPTSTLIALYFDGCDTPAGSDAASANGADTGTMSRPEASKASRALGLLSGRTGDVEAKRLVLGELDAAVAAEDEMLRDRCGLGSREVVLGTYKCVDRHATAGNLVLSSSYLSFDITHPGDKHGRDREPWVVALRDVLSVEKVTSKMTSVLSNPMHFELRDSDPAMFMGIDSVDAFIHDLGGQ
jgi:hypothetical protein